MKKYLLGWCTLQNKQCKSSRMHTARAYRNMAMHSFHACPHHSPRCGQVPWVYTIACPQFATCMPPSHHAYRPQQSPSACPFAMHAPGGCHHTWGVPFSAMGGACSLCQCHPPEGAMHAPQEQPCTPPGCNWGTPLPGATTHAPSGATMHAPPGATMHPPGSNHMHPSGDAYHVPLLGPQPWMPVPEQPRMPLSCVI